MKEAAQEAALLAEKAKANPMVVMSSGSSAGRRPVSAMASTRGERARQTRSGGGVRTKNDHSLIPEMDEVGNETGQAEEYRPPQGSKQRPSTAGLQRSTRKPVQLSSQQSQSKGSGSQLGSSLNVQASSFADRMRSMTGSQYKLASSSSGASAYASGSSRNSKIADVYGGSVGQKKARAQSASRARPVARQPAAARPQYF